MRTKAFLLLFLLVALFSWAISSLVFRSANRDELRPNETAYERVLRTKTLRCGYADWPPYVSVRDPNTGVYSGIAVDIIEKAATRLGLKVVWAETVGWANFIESLQSRRIDAFCSGLWRKAERGAYVAFSVPIFYSANYPYVREGDHRFDKDISLANSPDISFSVMDGEHSDVLAREFFPKAKRVSIPQLGQVTDILENVALKKADIVITETSFVRGYLEANPGKLRRTQDKPFQIFETAFGFEIHETLLRDMFDSALSELHNLGIIDQIISKYDPDPDDFLRVAKPYRANESAFR